MQSDRNSSKTDTFHGPTTHEPLVHTSSEQIMTFARHDYGRVCQKEFLQRLFSNPPEIIFLKIQENPRKICIFWIF